MPIPFFILEEIFGFLDNEAKATFLPVSIYWHQVLKSQLLKDYYVGSWEPWSVRRGLNSQEKTLVKSMHLESTDEAEAEDFFEGFSNLKEIHIRVNLESHIFERMLTSLSSIEGLAISSFQPAPDLIAISEKLKFLASLQIQLSHFDNEQVLDVIQTFEFPCLAALDMSIGEPCSRLMSIISSKFESLKKFTISYKDSPDDSFLFNSLDLKEVRFLKISHLTLKYPSSACIYLERFPLLKTFNTNVCLLGESFRGGAINQLKHLRLKSLDFSEDAPESTLNIKELRLNCFYINPREAAQLLSRCQALVNLKISYLNLPSQSFPADMVFNSLTRFRVHQFGFEAAPLLLWAAKSLPNLFFFSLNYESDFSLSFLETCGELHLFPALVFIEIRQSMCLLKYQELLSAAPKAERLLLPIDDFTVFGTQLKEQFSYISIVSRPTSLEVQF
ncbi:hypothetical protein DSO57_1031350 [Entomophthora muscae]|uniref:Uncharacterized protein n=1 Tax=Entomophthora muscae TaxID=34485 RepID=A0ACC2S2S6_9FUNG|nr:hypothetical protein DSO57_1031350 [Entomophthora muscae]